MSLLKQSESLMTFKSN